MAYVAVEKDGTSWIFNYKRYRYKRIRGNQMTNNYNIKDYKTFPLVMFIIVVSSAFYEIFLGSPTTGLAIHTGINLIIWATLLQNDYAINQQYKEAFHSRDFGKMA